MSSPLPCRREEAASARRSCWATSSSRWIPPPAKPRSRVTLHQRLTILLIHGMLHLLGYDHERSAREAMGMAEREKEFFSNC